jgi:hypothetical protein
MSPPKRGVLSWATRRHRVPPRSGAHAGRPVEPDRRRGGGPALATPSVVMRCRAPAGRGETVRSSRVGVPATRRPRRDYRPEGLGSVTPPGADGWPGFPLPVSPRERQLSSTMTTMTTMRTATAMAMLRVVIRCPPKGESERSHGAMLLNLLVVSAGPPRPTSRPDHRRERQWPTSASKLYERGPRRRRLSLPRQQTLDARAYGMTRGGVSTFDRDAVRAPHATRRDRPTAPAGPLSSTSTTR